MHDASAPWEVVTFYVLLGLRETGIARNRSVPAMRICPKIHGEDSAPSLQVPWSYLFVRDKT